MIELAIGTKFYYDGRLCEVVEAQSDKCKECVVGCNAFVKLGCNSKYRQDGKNVCFKLVQE